MALGRSYQRGHWHHDDHAAHFDDPVMLALHPDHANRDNIVDAVAQAIVQVLDRFHYDTAEIVQESDGRRAIVAAGDNARHNGASTVLLPGLSVVVNITNP